MIITAILCTLKGKILPGVCAIVAILIAANDDLFSPVGIGRMLISAVITGLVAYFFWWRQSRSTRKRDEAREKEAIQLQKDLDAANEEKERIAGGHEELVARVTKSETALGGLMKQIAMMELEARPLFEAAKIKLIEALTHPDPEFEVPDALLKLTLGPNGYITPELAKLLKERETSTHPDVTPKEKLAAAILQDVVELAAIEAKVVGPVTSQLVSSPAVSPNEESKVRK